MERRDFWTGNIILPKPPGRKKIGDGKRARVLARFGGLCGYCGKDPATVLDHIKAYAHGGLDVEENLMPACGPCNSFKHVFTIEEFRRELELQIERGLKRSVNMRTAIRFGLLEMRALPIVFFFEREGASNGDQGLPVQGA